jgi:hypothetical protein
MLSLWTGINKREIREVRTTIEHMKLTIERVERQNHDTLLIDQEECTTQSEVQ